MSDNVNAIKTGVYEKRGTILKNSLAFALIFVILILEGCVNFVDMTFVPKRILEPSLWVHVGLRVMLLLLIRTAMSLMFMDIARKSNRDLFKVQLKNGKLMKLKDNDFSDFIENYKNKQIKKEFYTKKIQKKLYKLEKNAKASDRLLYFNNDPASEIEKKNNKYCIKRALLEKQLSPEYQEQYYDVLDISKYPQIDPAIFDIPVNVKNENIYQLSSRAKKVIAISILTAAISLIFMQTIKRMTEFDETSVSAVTIATNIILDVLFIVMQGGQGVYQSFNIVAEEEVTPYVNRNRILKEYLYWKKPNDTSKIDLLLDAMEKEIEPKGEKKKEETIK